MNVNAIGALSAYTYQNTLAQTGSSNQALSQALAATQSQAGDMTSLLSSLGATDPFATLNASSSLEALSALTYSASAASGQGPSAVLAQLRTQSSSATSLFSGTDGLSLSAAVMSPSATEALVRYTYDQSQNHTASAATTASQAIASGQQSLMASTLNLLA